MKCGKKIRLLILMARTEDRITLYNYLRRRPEIDVVAVTADPYQARDQIIAHRPHLVVLGLELPRMSGMEFLEVLDRYWPLPSIVITSRLEMQPELAVQARALGAIAVLQRPPEGIKALVNKLPALASSLDQEGAATYATGSELVIAIGASTGGTVALRSILSELPASMPPILIVQHMPQRFTSLLAASLNNISRLEVVEVTARLVLRNNAVFLAPGGRHLVLQRRDGFLEAALTDAEPVNKHKPSVDVLFLSVAKVMGAGAIGLILTGMGADGAEGLLAMHQAGAYTMAQDRASSVVYGMPREAVARGAVHASVPLSRVPDRLLAAMNSFQGIMPPV